MEQSLSVAAGHTAVVGITGDFRPHAAALAAFPATQEVGNNVVAGAGFGIYFRHRVLRVRLR